MGVDVEAETLDESDGGSTAAVATAASEGFAGCVAAAASGGSTAAVATAVATGPAGWIATIAEDAELPAVPTVRVKLRAL
jgi:hypothetical protein